MSTGNSINVYLESDLLISRCAYTFFLKITFHVEVSYTGEYLLSIHYLILLFLSQVPTEVGVASHMGSQYLKAAFPFPSLLVDSLFR